MLSFLKSQLRRVAVLREFAEFRRRPRPLIPVAAALGSGCVDAVMLHQDGVVSAEGWTLDLGQLRAALSLVVDGVVLAPTHAFRVSRPDVDSLRRDGFAGARIEWVLPPHGTRRHAELHGDGVRLAAFDLEPLVHLAYEHLRATPHVAGRDGIYGFGPPVHEVSGEVLALARHLPEPILDFGCGGGALVRALRREGKEIYGLELDNSRIRQHLLEEAKPFVTLYDGALPAPFADRAFASVTSSEVLEHIPSPVTAIAEMARLAAERLFITVPDMSAIPRGFAHHVVPWHLLESTHVNFFTQQSLEAALAPHAASIEMSRIGAVRCDRMLFHTSLAAVATIGTR